MRAPSTTRLLIGLAMCVAAGLSVAMSPTRSSAKDEAAIHLETMIPARFGGWRQQATPTPIIMTPVMQNTLNRLYSQTLTRTYVNGKGQRIMLSIAYGGRQAGDLEVHRPEFCYASQGFQVSSLSGGNIETPWGVIPVMRLLATHGARIEPITYWITVGDTAVGNKLQQRLAQLRYGLTGQVPDGILIRVSNVGERGPEAYRLHGEFVKAMLAAMKAPDRARLDGLGAHG